MGVGLLGELYSVWVGGAEGTDVLHNLTEAGQLHSDIDDHYLIACTPGQSFSPLPP